MQNSSKPQASLKEILPYGSLTQISILSGKSLSTCIRVINGQSQNRVVLQAISTYLSQLAETKTKIESSVEVLTVN